MPAHAVAAAANEGEATGDAMRENSTEASRGPNPEDEAALMAVLVRSASSTESRLVGVACANITYNHFVFTPHGLAFVSVSTSIPLAQSTM